jgi:hypothetical protein
VQKNYSSNFNQLQETILFDGFVSAEKEEGDNFYLLKEAKASLSRNIRK